MSVYHQLPSDEDRGDKAKLPELSESVIRRFPLVNDKQVRFLATWRGTALVGAGIAVTAGVLNLAILIWALTFPRSNGFATVYVGDPDKTRQLDIGSKLFINIVGTAILISSSRCTQFLCAPTRDEVNAAHSQRSWLDIGIRSWRNFKAVDRWRKWLVVMLFASSVPIHLIYNSTVLATRAARDYVAITVDPSFVQGVSAAPKLLPGMNASTQGYLYSIAQELQNSSGLVNMTSSECMKSYQTQFQSQFGNLLLVSSELNASKLSTHNQSIVAGFLLGTAGQPGKPGSYMLDSWSSDDALLNPSDQLGSSLFAAVADCALSSASSCASNGSFSLALVDYCLVQPTIQKSTFSVNIGFMVAVICANALKGASLLWACRKRSTPLITTGDAIASFLADPDEHTAYLGPLSVLDIRAGAVPQSTTFRKPKKPLRWFKGPSPGRWVMGTVTLLVPLGIGMLVMFWQETGFSENSPNLVRVATGFFASVFDPPMITFGHSFAAIALVVNSPQILLTVIYLCVNNLLTSMALVHEYHSYVVKRKTLRVTREQKGQRTTYFLSLPNKYALPLIVTWTVIHWLIAQSITLVRVTVVNPSGQEELTYTAIQMVGEWFFGFTIPTIVLALALVLLGIRKLPGGVPLARTCSLAISAICHRDAKEDSDMVFKPLQFGVIPSTNGLPRIGFSAEPVEPVESGVSYTSCGKASTLSPDLQGQRYQFKNLEAYSIPYESSRHDLRVDEAFEMGPRSVELSKDRVSAGWESAEPG